MLINVIELISKYINHEFPFQLAPIITSFITVFFFFFFQMIITSPYLSLCCLKASILSNNSLPHIILNSLTICLYTDTFICVCIYVCIHILEYVHISFPILYPYLVPKLISDSGSGV